MVREGRWSMNRNCSATVRERVRSSLGKWASREEFFSGKPQNLKMLSQDGRVGRRMWMWSR
jgi:hypothetical protein